MLAVVEGTSTTTVCPIFGGPMFLSFK